MSRSLLTLTFAALAAFALARDARAETVHLKTGETLAGNVRMDGDHVIVDTFYPTISTLRIRKDDLLPESLYDILERRTDVKDAPGRRALAETAEQLGLKGAALVEYLRARNFEPSSAAELDPKIQRLTEDIAADLLEDAEDLLAAGMPNSAVVRLDAVLQRFPDTKTAVRARALLPKAKEATQETPKGDDPAMSPEQVAKIADRVEKNLAKGEEASALARGHAGASGTRELRVVERAIDHLERAWERTKDLRGASDDAALAQKVATLRERARTGLVAAYLRAGTILIQRRAIPGAERYCDKACELDPANETSHELHRLIHEGLRGRTGPSSRLFAARTPGSPSVPRSSSRGSPPSFASDVRVRPRASRWS
jgi:hypothetical protein